MDRDQKSSAAGRHRIPNAERLQCLELFDKGCGYKKTAAKTGLNIYTVRDYRRRYAQGDESWAYREWGKTTSL